MIPGITAGNIGISVKLPELNDPGVGKVMARLAVNSIGSSGTQSANIAIASTSLDPAGTKLVAVFDVSLIKSVFNSAGNQTSTEKVSNSSIGSPITVWIPVPADYTGRTDLQVMYIDDSGNVTPLSTGPCHLRRYPVPAVHDCAFLGVCSHSNEKKHPPHLTPIQEITACRRA